MTRKRIQLGLIHVAVAMTLVPINSTLNRVMIKELALSATLVAVLASLPYFFSPIQVAIGSFADAHPLRGYRRSPYVLAGLLLCAVGVAFAPQAAFLMAENLPLGIVAGLLTFGAWGMGFNLASVSYFSLIAELFGERQRGRTIAVMWVMMIISIILTALVLSQMVEPYTPAGLERAFGVVAVAALGLGVLGLLGLEPRFTLASAGRQEYPWGTLVRFAWQNRQVRLFFVYLVILLAALLGQDILLEPFGAEAFGLSVRQTTRITSLWGACTLAAMVLAGALEARLPKRRVAIVGGWGALFGFATIVVSGSLHNTAIFYSGVVLLGLGTGLSTIANLSLMMDMTAAGKVGLFMGIWGMANAFSRLSGSVLGGALRDAVARLSGLPLLSYQVVFAIMAAIIFISLLLLRAVDVSAFRRQAEGEIPLAERAALVSDLG